MINNIIEWRDRRRTTKIEKIFKNFSFKPITIEDTNNYKVLRCYTRRSEIEGLEVNHVTIGNHLRKQFEYYDYFMEGRTKFSSTWKNYPNKEIGEEEYYVNLMKKKYDVVCENLSKELRSLPNYEGTCYRYSAIQNLDTYGRKIKNGDLVMDKSYLSSSIYKGSGGLALWGVNDPEEKANGNFIIKSRSGKYIQSISGASNEHEVLFDKQTVFKVSKIINSSKTVFFIYLEEVEKERHKIKDIYTGEFSF